MIFLADDYCAVCERPTKRRLLCRACEKELTYAHRSRQVGVPCHYPLLYNNFLKGIVLDFKYEKKTWYVHFLTALLQEEFERVDGGRANVLTYLPMTREKEWVRGYNHAELLCRELAKRVDLPVWSFEREASGGLQHLRKRRQRREGLRFQAEGPIPEGLVLIDDFITSGQTLKSAISFLGEEKVEYALVLASSAEES